MPEMSFIKCDLMSATNGVKQMTEPSPLQPEGPARDY